MPKSSTYIIPDTTLMLDGSPSDHAYTIHDLPTEEKPREKLQSQGPATLSIKELLAVIMTVGTTKEDLLGMSGRIVNEYGEKNIFAEKDPSKLAKDADIPIVKACQVVACGEIGRRLFDNSFSAFTVVRNAKEVYEYLTDMRNLTKENIRGLYLNSHNRVIRDETISIGTVSSNLMHPREVFQPAIEVNAVSLILAHNHPSGVLAPSDEDVRITEQLVQAGKILGIRVLDHVIITKDGFVSVPVNYS
jgi:DNA repair protein RadC